jgi:hypothetical protein
VLGYINTATGSGGALNPQTDPNLNDFVWQSPGLQIERQYVMRLDHNLTANHRLSGVYNWQVVDRDPDQLNNGDIRFPSAINYSKYTSYRPLASASVRSVLGSNLVNELRGGARWGPGYFGRDFTNGIDTFSDQDGYALDLTVSNTNAGGLNVTNWFTENAPTARQRLELEHRRHADLAEGQAQSQLRHVAVLRPRVGGRAAGGAGDSARRRLQRSGVQPVQHDEFSRRIDLNVFDNVNFTPLALPATNRSASTIFQVTEGYTDASNTFDPGGRLGQLVLRVSW